MKQDSVLDKIIAAGERGGWALALIVAIVAMFFAWLAFNPVKEAGEEVSDHVAEPALRAAGIIAGVCPDGFKDASAKDEHGRVKACFKGADLDHPQPGDWIVSLNSDGFFDHAIQVDTPNSTIVYDSAQVPGWPR